VEKFNPSPTLLFFNQLSGVSDAIQTIIKNDVEISSNTISYVQKLRDYFLECASDKPLTILPEIDNDSNIADIFILVCAMKYSIETLLTKEEKEGLFVQSSKWIGLATKAKELIG